MCESRSRGTQEALGTLGQSSDKTSATGWQACNERGSACGCHAACLATARVHTGRVLPRNALARNWGVRWWLWQYISRQECHSKSKRLPANSDDRKTTSRALRKERVDHENGLSRGVPRGYELCLSSGVAERYRRESTLLRRLGYCEKLHRVYSASCSRLFIIFVNIFRQC